MEADFDRAFDARAYADMLEQARAQRQQRLDRIHQQRQGHASATVSSSGAAPPSATFHRPYSAQLGASAGLASRGGTARPASASYMSATASAGAVAPRSHSHQMPTLLPAGDDDASDQVVADFEDSDFPVVFSSSSAASSPSRPTSALTSASSSSAAARSIRPSSASVSAMAASVASGAPVTPELMAAIRALASALEALVHAQSTGYLWNIWLLVFVICRFIRRSS